jgi:hypothetical protein
MMKPGQLFVSFWDLCLENLPVGTFSRRRVPTPEAKAIIEQARRYGSLRCVTGDDLLAPYKKRERKNHDKPCRALGEHFGINLSLGDFADKHEIDGEDSYTIHPLDFARVRGGDRLMVVTCDFTMAKEKGDELVAFDIAPDSVKFHLFEAVEQSGAARRSSPPCRRHRIARSNLRPSPNRSPCARLRRSATRATSRREEAQAPLRLGVLPAWLGDQRSRPGLVPACR